MMFPPALTLSPRVDEISSLYSSKFSCTFLGHSTRLTRQSNGGRRGASDDHRRRHVFPRPHLSPYFHVTSKAFVPPNKKQTSRSCHVGCAACHLPPRSSRFRQSPFVTCEKRLHRNKQHMHTRFDASSTFSSEIPTNTQRSNPTNPLSPPLASS